MKTTLIGATRSVLAAIAVGLAVFVSGATQSSAENWRDPMSFRVMTTGGKCPSCTWIQAYGRIEPDTPRRFQEFVVAEGLSDTGGVQVHLSSPGGALIAGMELGRLIRAYRMNTAISTSTTKEALPGGQYLADPVDHLTTCGSACNFAYFGGVVRHASRTTPAEAVGFQKLGRLAAHQFYKADALINPDAPTRTANDAIQDQLIVALLIAFLDEMGVSAEFLQLAASTPPSEFHYFTEDELLRTGADNFATRELFIVGYRNGVAITELQFSRADADYRVELYCAKQSMHMLVSVDWRRNYDIGGHRSWNMLDGVRMDLPDGTSVSLQKVSEEFSNSLTATSGKFRFSFNGVPLERIVPVKHFAFYDSSSRYASDAANAMSFVLPETFDGLFLLPRSCMQ